MSSFKGDFLGFTYNNKHSSDFGIVRTSNGSRFDENLLPTTQDKTVQIPGGDGTYFFGSYYTQRQFSVPFAFDNMSESQLRELREFFGDKQIHPLVFDERPYKTYQAKVTGTATLKHVPFCVKVKDEDGDGEVEKRIYKGEGTIQFTCYQPYAVCSKKWQKDYDDVENLNEWVEASGLLYEQGDYNRMVDGQIKLYNPGDIPAHFKLYFTFKNSAIEAGEMQLIHKGQKLGQLKWRGFQQKKEKDVYIVFDSQTNLIEGLDENKMKTGALYNEYINGAFFKIPKGEALLQFIDTKMTKDDVEIEYDYWYI